MIRFSVCGMPVSAHPLAILTWILALCLGKGGELPAVLFALTCHEFAHGIAARRAGVHISEIRLMPFGGAAQIENPYALRPKQLIFVAMAAPCANGICMILFAALGWAGIFSPSAANLRIRANAALMLFNCLPALPLDGGRALYAILSPKIGRKRAVTIGIAFGYALGIALVAACIAGYIAVRHINLTLPICAVFLFASAPTEREALHDGSARAMLRACEPYGSPKPVRLYAVDANQTIAAALRISHGNRSALFCVYRDGVLQGFYDENALLRGIADGHNTLRALTCVSPPTPASRRSF